MKKTTKTTKPRTKVKTSQVKARHRELDVGELDQIYGGRLEDSGTKDA
jgi:hypothetical protein